MNGLGLALAVLSSVEPDLCYLPPVSTKIHIDVHSHLPPLADRGKFHGMGEAKEQIEHCKEWISYCEMRRGYSYDDGHWDRQIASLKWTKHYWGLVFNIGNDALLCERAKRDYLQKLREFLGDKLYAEYYIPPLLPAVPSPMMKE